VEPRGEPTNGDRERLQLRLGRARRGAEDAAEGDVDEVLGAGRERAAEDARRDETRTLAKGQKSAAIFVGGGAFARREGIRARDPPPRRRLGNRL
jgi:hypothetical protein